MTAARPDADFSHSVRDWLAQDPDATTRAELKRLLADPSSAALTALHDRFDTRLEFGTAGLRGALGAGPNRMNRVLVAQTAAGFAAWLLSRESTASVVIGYDGRTNSRVFAIDTAELMAGAGVRVILLPRLLPTPVLAFAVRHFGVSAGVMVTASHNPAADNGYKVYLGGVDRGAQIVAPADAEIATQIYAVAHRQRVDELPRSTNYATCDETVIDEYVRETAALASTSTSASTGTSTGAGAAGDAARHPAITFVYTALHGVGWQTASRVFASAGFATPISVIEQQEPDAAFPTVVFPNPEEPGALDAAFAVATAADATLIIANDPDADRLAVAIPITTLPAAPTTSAAAAAAETPRLSGWRRLTGNEVGALLGWRAAERAVERAVERAGAHASSQPGSPAGSPPGSPAGTPTGRPVGRPVGRPAGSDTRFAAVGPDAIRPRGTLAVSLVSSPALGEVARQYGLDFAETLTGFKWISRAPDLIFGFEEALGYLVDPAKIRDKDGISAAVDILTLATELAAVGETLDGRLLAFAERFGGYASGQLSVRVSDRAEIPPIMARLRAQPPTTIGAHAIDRIDDFRDGFGAYPASNILRMWLVDGSRLIVRPSGTEPKLKVYLDAVSTTGTGRERLSAAAAIVATLEAGIRELLAAEPSVAGTRH